MKVVLEAQHAVGHPNLRGVGYYSLYTIEALLKRKKYNYELTFFDFEKGAGNLARAEQYFSKYNIPIRECNTLDYRVASRDDSVFSKISYNEYTGTNADIYHFMCPVSIPTNLNGKMILTIHDLIWESYHGAMPQHTVDLHKIATRRFNQIKPFVIADSFATRNDILKYTDIPEEFINVVYLSCDEENMYPEKYDVSDIVKGDYFLYIGAFESKKNIPGIIKAFNIVAEKNKDIKLVIAGKKVWDDCSLIFETVQASPYKERIIFPGYIDTVQKRRLYSNARAFVFPSRCEGFGIPVLEAMACGCPVITANNTSLLEVGGDAVSYVEYNNIEQIAFEMNKMLNDDSFRENLIKKGFEQKTNFSWEKSAEQVEAVYERIYNL